MGLCHRGHDSTELFHRIGVYGGDFIKALDALMLPIYLSSEFMGEDTAYRGAIQLLHLIYRANGRVYFVSSRFQSSQESGTLKNLVENHFYRNRKQSFLYLRRDGEASLNFKKRAFQEIKSGMSNGDIEFLVAENEPENLNAMMHAFPQAIPVFVTGAILNSATPLEANARLIITPDFVND